jgi:hypothetical protein
MVILVIIMTSLTAVLVSASHTEVDTNKRFQAQQNDRTGLDKLRREIHCASGDRHERELAHRRHRLKRSHGDAPLAVPDERRRDDVRDVVHVGQHAYDRRLRPLPRSPRRRCPPDLRLGGKDQVGRLPDRVDALLPPELEHGV